jgi:hypothetical protein
MNEHDELLQIARDGAKAHADDDSGRSRYLISRVADIMLELSVAECEWLSIAVSNGAFNRAINESPAEDVNVGVQQTQQGEVWDI